MATTFLRLSDAQWINPDAIVHVVYQPHNSLRVVHLGTRSQPLHLTEKEIQVVLDWLADKAVPN